MPEVLEIAHIALEYKAGVGGIKAVMLGLLPAQANSGAIKPAIITPFYDVYQDIYNGDELEFIDTITHIYKGKPHKSNVYRVCNDIINGIPIYHYLIRPVADSPVARLFDVGLEKDIYQSFPHSDANNRYEYFNAATAVLVRSQIYGVPEWDIVHAHTWHTGLACCLIKELENLPAYREILQTNIKPLQKIPHIIATLHMLRSADHGVLNYQGPASLLKSVGLPDDFLKQFPNYSQHINQNHIKRAFLHLIYADSVNAVSKGLYAELINGKGEGFDKLLLELNKQDRLCGITNGTDTEYWTATNHNNLKEYTFNSATISADKKRLKEHLHQIYPALDPNKHWFIFIGRFAAEKGVDYLLDLLTAVKKVNGNLIVLGSHVVIKIQDGKAVSRYQDIVDVLKNDPNVVVLDEAAAQEQYGKLLRAASDCAVSLSINEPCGLVPMELMTCGAISVAPRIQGLPDTVIPLNEDADNGTGFLYDGALENRLENLTTALDAAENFLTTQAAAGTLDRFLQKLVANSYKHDWKESPAQEYLKLYKKTLLRDVLTADQVRNIPGKSVLHQFNNPPSQNFKIWQIGFNRCGSSTLHLFLARNGIVSIHYGINGDLASCIQNNYLNNKPLLNENFQKYQAFFDMENIYEDPPIYIAQTLFKELDRQYPGSKFILNTRNKSDWIKSRLKQIDPVNGTNYANYLCKKYGITETELIDRWSREWDEHHLAVLEYFKDRPEDLLVFNIDYDGPEKIQKFFGKYFKLNPGLYQHSNNGASVIVPKYNEV